MTKDHTLAERLRDLALHAEVPFIAWDTASEAADEIERLQRIEAAAREEHGGRAYDVECPICYALDQGDPKIDSVPEPFRSRTMKIHCDMHGWQYTIGMKCMECAKMTKDINALIGRLRGIRVDGVEIPTMMREAADEIERLRAEIIRLTATSAPDTEQELTHPSAHPSTPWEVP